MWVIFLIIILFLIGVTIFLKHKKRLDKFTPLAGISLALILAGILLEGFYIIGYFLIGIGLALAIIDICANKK